MAAYIRVLTNILLTLMFVYASRSEQNIGQFTRNTGSCMLDGEVYEDKHEFVTKDCALSCTCVRSRLTCTTSCPVLVGECPKQHKIEFLKVGIEKTSGCRCPQKRRCILGGSTTEHKYSLSYIHGLEEDKELLTQNDTSPCYVDGGKYQPGEKYATKDCRALCVCNTNFASCTPLCQEKKQLSCPAGFTPSSIRQPAATGSNCACDTPTCLEE